jgi:hypothetical protein
MFTLRDYRCCIRNSAYFPNWRLGVQFIEQYLGVFEIGRVEPFGEPDVDFREHRARFIATALLGQQAGEMYSSAQLPLFGLLMRCNLDRLSKARFCFIFGIGFRLREQQTPLMRHNSAFQPTSPVRSDDSSPSATSCCTACFSTAFGQYGVAEGWQKRS